eukprot:234876-Rhodomonas_salina.1
MRTIRGATCYIATDGNGKWSLPVVVTNQPMPVRGNLEGLRRPGSPVARRASNWARAAVYPMDSQFCTHVLWEPENPERAQDVAEAANGMSRPPLIQDDHSGGMFGRILFGGDDDAVRHEVRNVGRALRPYFVNPLRD